MADEQKITLTVERDGERSTTEAPLRGELKVVLVINNQFSDAVNTTQIASGAGRSSSAGNNAALDSSNTLQQQSVGADGEADNRGMNGEQTQPRRKRVGEDADRELVIVINNQIHRQAPELGLPKPKPKSKPEPMFQSAATQVASGAGFFSTGGTNAAIESSNTKQQHAVGGGEGATAENRGLNDDQVER